MKYEKIEKTIVLILDLGKINRKFIFFFKKAEFGDGPLKVSCPGTLRCIDADIHELCLADPQDPRETAAEATSGLL